MGHPEDFFGTRLTEKGKGSHVRKADLHHPLADSLKVKMVHVPLCTLKYLPNECLAVPVSTAWACQQRDALLAERLLQGVKNFVKAFFIF